MATPHKGKHLWTNSKQGELFRETTNRHNWKTTTKLILHAWAAVKSTLRPYLSLSIYIYINIYIYIYIYIDRSWSP